MTAYPALMTDKDSEITAVVLRERSRLGNFVRRRVPDAADAEDILQEVFYEFINAYRLPASIEQASAWLFRVARNRIIDRYRKRREQSISQRSEPQEGEDQDEEQRLDLMLPATDAGPEAEYARSAVLTALQRALEELPDAQREVFVAHEFEGRSFKELSAQSGVAVNTLLTRKRQAVLQLRERLQTTYDELEL
jgi:RNA polymerase sigma factor (sigma-70 family)